LADLWQLLEARQSFVSRPRVRHVDRTSDVLHGVGLAVNLLGNLAGAVLSSGGRSHRGGSGGFGGFGSSSGRGFGGGGFSSGRGFGGGGGFTSGKGF
jgi:hypothetical protein